MAIELVVPEVGESITDVEIGEWLKAPGDFVERDEAIVEIESEEKGGIGQGPPDVSHAGHFNLSDGLRARDGCDGGGWNTHERQMHDCVAANEPERHIDPGFTFVAYTSGHGSRYGLGSQ